VARPKGDKQMTYRTAVRFPAEAGEELERVAKEMGVAPAVAVRLWVMEKLRSMRNTTPATTANHPTPPRSVS